MVALGQEAKEPPAVENVVAEDKGQETNNEQAAPEERDKQPAAEPKPAPPITVEGEADTFINEGAKSFDSEPKPTKDEARADGDLKAQQEMARWAYWVVIVAGVQVFFTVIALILVWRTLGETRKATAAAMVAAKAAEAVVDVTEDTAKRQLRAYLTVGGCELEYLEDGAGFVLQAHLRNSGITPAFNVRVMGESFGTSYPLAEQKPHPTPRRDHGTPLGAGAEIVTAQRIFTDDAEETMVRVVAGEIGLWIQGTAIYEDCFGVEHTLQFRYVIGGRLAGIGGIVFHADKEGNYAD